MSDGSDSVVLRLPEPARAWHRRLAAELTERGVDVVVRRGRRLRLEFGVEAVLRCERLLGRTATSVEEVAIDPAGPAPLAAARATVILDGSDGVYGSMQPLFNGSPDERHLFKSLLASRAPVLSVAEAAAPGVVRLAALPALSDRLSFARSLDEVYNRLVTLLVKALLAPPAAMPDLMPLPAAVPFPFATPAGFVARRLGARAYGRARRREDHWRVAVRRSGGTQADTAIRILGDDGQRYYADPFPFEKDGRTHVFFEDYSLRSRKGVITTASLDEHGFSPPVVVLERPYHLSYPFVFEDAGSVYMIPETAGAGRVELYRADPFPQRWHLDRVLLDNVAVADATLIRHEGRHWMFAALAGSSGSSCDQLMIFHAQDVRGPWTPHAGNPVLIDAGAARPAGRMWHENGVLMRVAQDCRRGYGDGVVILRVNRLSPDAFSQSVVDVVQAPPGFHADGLHTLNRHGGAEFIDLRGTRQRRR